VVGADVDDDVWARVADDAANGIGVRQLELRAIGCYDLLHDRRQRASELVAELPVLPYQQDPQAKVSVDLSDAPRRSRSARTGSPCSGQRMPRAGSFHSSTRSCSGA